VVAAEVIGVGEDGEEGRDEGGGSARSQNK